MHRLYNLFSACERILLKTLNVISNRENARFLAIFFLAPTITLIIKIVYFIVENKWTIACTDLLGASIGICLACFAEIATLKTDNKFPAYLSMIAGGFIVAITFAYMIPNEIKETVKISQIIWSIIISISTITICLCLTYKAIKQVKDSESQSDNLAHDAI